MASSQTFTLNIKALFDASDVKAKVNDLQNAFKNIRLPSDLQKNFDTSLSNLTKALNDFESRAAKGVSSKADAKGITNSIDTVIKEFSKVEEVVGKIKTEFGSAVDLSQFVKLDDATLNKIKNLREEIKQLQQQITDVTGSKLEQVNNALAKIKSKGAKSGAEAAIKLFDEGNIDAALQKLEEVEAKQKQLLSSKTDQQGNTVYSYNEATRATATANLQAIGELRSQFQAAQTEVSGITSEINAKTAEIGNTAQQASSQVINGATQAADALTKEGTAAGDARNNIVDLANGQAQFNREVDQVKSRIQYFFGLNNAINLVKRAIRGAVDTIKELDKAMTETAVVTDFTVSDMWKQLPEYTKRANELGVTTQAAYEAATLYYQQGLKTEEVNALSVETLKMARIAGLDAAEATDRMTNALRGFNMELDAQSAQRVDDVYSELAANTASNVDEISTAMTKVASLAHSANMEFETTAAFLAQIIETTRESAETAGTALKTVVARFSEVKKLVDTNQLKGQDEEGQVVDVNKVSAALRTAGIDLNKYFLGEVGLDDIFMELASKWDSLTSVQQRYIATQAAGSRQQSRFIALMQDYSRTQELVGKAYNAEGASARQFEKTQDSLESKLARLKNAWNEFLMGLTNNVMVKSFVDILTNLLNIVNKLTSAFGEGTGSVLKWVAAASAIGGLRRLFVDGGLATRVIGGLLGNGLGANKFRASMGLGTIDEKGQYSAYSRDELRANRGPTIIGNIKGLGAGLKDFGTKAWTSAGALGSIYGLEGAAASIAGIATALGAVAAAVGVVIAGYQAWLRLTPEGHLKQAKELAETMNTVAANTQKNAAEFKKASVNYKEYDDAVKSATSIAEYQEAVENRTAYVSELIQNNSNLAEYVETDLEGGKLALTINEASLEKASQDLSDQVSSALSAADFANALEEQATAVVLSNEIKYHGVNLENKTISNPEETNALTPEELAKYSKIQRQVDAARAKSESYLQQAYSRQLEDSGLDDEIVKTLSTALAKGFDSDDYLKRVNEQRAENWWTQKGTKSELKDQYKTLYGYEADSSMTRRDLAKAVAQAQVGEEEQAKTTSIAKAVQSGRYDEILKAMAGEIDFSDDDIEAANDKLQDFADILGKDIAEVKEQINTSQKARQEIKKSNQADIFEQALKSGHGVTQDFSDTIKNLDYDQLNVVSDIINQAAGKVSEQTFQSLFDTLPTMSNEALQELQGFFDNFNLDNPITALEQLNNKITEVGTNSSFGKLLLDIKETNKSLFESSNLVQTFLLSESYESLGDTIEDLIKDNKKLNGKNIEDMAESCDELDALLDELNDNFEENIDSAQALAETINLIGDGSLAIDQITNSLLAALGAGESFETLIGKVQQWIEDFNKGTDLTEGVDHITSVAQDALELVGEWQFGNEPLMNIYDHLFGDGAYDAYMKANWGKKSFDQLEKEIGGEIQRISDMAENEGLGALQFLSTKGIGITDKGNNEFEWDLSRYKDQENPVQTAIQDVATQLGVTEDAARAFIEGWASHMWDLQQEWNDLNFTDSMQAFSEELGNQSVITQAELDALIAKTGKTKTEILSALEEIRGKGNVPIVVNWQDAKGGNLSGQGLIDEFNETVKAPTQTTTRYNNSTLETTTKTDYSKFLSGIDDVNRKVKDEFGNTFNTLDFDTLHNHLVEALKLTPAQATEVANNISKETGQQLSKEIEIPIKAADGSIQTETRVITASSSEALQAGIDAALQAANYALVAEELANQDVSTVGDKLGKSIEEGGLSGVATVQSAISSLNTNVIVKITYEETNSPPQLATGGIVTINSTRATGGIAKSYAKGSENFHVSAGTALTGEEGPELVWNKEKGYSYLTGESGPEFQNLQPGDRIFNASETKKILKNSSAATGGVVPSYAAGGWKDGEASGGSGSGKKKSGSDKEKTPEEWKNELDWLYNLMEDIAELERQQTELEEKYEDLLTDEAATGHDLYKLLIQQLGNLYTQLNHQTFALEKREQEMREFMDTTNDKDQYLWYNWQDRTLEIDWDAIDRITDEEEYKHVKELVDEAEDIQDKMDDAEDAIQDIENQIQELENIWRDTFTDFEKRVYEAIVKSYQDVIDNYSELNDTLNNSNQAILDSLQKEISLQRQIRDNTKTEEQIADSEAQLAYMRRDTTGGNTLAALELEKQLAEDRENYEDTLIDQAISRLSDDNSAAAEQREHQIEIMQAQLDYAQENGEYWNMVTQLIAEATGDDGQLLTNTRLEQLLQNNESWDSMSETQQAVWEEELTGTFKEVVAYLLKENSELNGTFYTALTAAVDTVGAAIGSYSQAVTKLGNQVQAAASSSSGGGGGGYSGSSTSPSYDPLKDKTKSKSGAIGAGIASGIAAGAAAIVIKPPKFATGGLANYKGPAWLDGTPSEPEYVLNARQTDAFLKLADVLPSVMGPNGATTTNTFGAMYLNFDINVDQLASDYDVDQLVNRVKSDIYDAASYRGVNVLNLSR